MHTSRIIPNKVVNWHESKTCLTGLSNHTLHPSLSPPSNNLSSGWLNKHYREDRQTNKILYSQRYEPQIFRDLKLGGCLFNIHVWFYAFEIFQPFRWFLHKGFCSSIGSFWLSSVDLTFRACLLIRSRLLLT